MSHNFELQIGVIVLDSVQAGFEPVKKGPYGFRHILIWERIRFGLLWKTFALKGYTASRFTFSEKRKTVWGEICRYLNRHYIPEGSAVLELGSGYGDFIGQIKAHEKVAIEIDDVHEERMRSYPDVKMLFGSSMDLLPTLERSCFDVIFVSNYFDTYCSTYDN